ncbi:MAG: hypothetical protein QXS19_00225 [Candidatus Methanomethylicia archaeon]
MKIQDIIWEYFRCIYNPWLSDNWYRFSKSLREDLLMFRDKLYGCKSMEELKETIYTLTRLYMISPNEIKDQFMEMLRKTEEYYRKKGVEIDLNKRLKLHKVQIVVKDEDRRPLKSVQITVMYDGREIWKGTTQENGRITLNLNEGKYTIFASINEEEWYGLNIVELNVPMETEEKTITIKRHQKYETIKAAIKETES